MSVAENFLLAEASIVERLREHVTGAAFVGTATEMEQIEERSQRTPAVYVLFNGMTPEENRGNGKVQRISQTWLVVAAVRNVASQNDGSATREDAGRLLAQVLPALQGYRPDTDLGAMTLQASGAPEHNAGFMYIPTTWTITATTRGI